MNVTMPAVRLFAGNLRPNPAETIEKGVELGADPVQQDLFALSAGVADVKSASEFAELGRSKGESSWQKGAYSVAGALTGSPAAGLGLVSTVESLFQDPVSRGFFAVAGSVVGSEELSAIKDITTGYGATPAENGLLGVAAAVAGLEGAQEAVNIGLAEGKSTEEGAYFALATALAGGAQGLGSTLDVARDFASSPTLAGPYAVAAALAGPEDATAALRMAEDLGQTDAEKAMFALVGGLVGAERGPGFVRMSRALSPTEGQTPAMAVAAALTAAGTDTSREAAVAGAVLLGAGP